MNEAIEGYTSFIFKYIYSLPPLPFPNENNKKREMDRRGRKASGGEGERENKTPSRKD